MPRPFYRKPSINTSIPEVLNLTCPHTGDADKLLSLAKTFNKITGSSRPLIPDFYDCGTNARAVFMHLIRFHRQNLPNFYVPRHKENAGVALTNAEKETIRESFQPQHSNINTLEEASDTLRYMSDGVMILTVRFHLPAQVLATTTSLKNGPNYILNNPQFGHVWVIEKKNDRFYIYQSSLNEYSIPEFHDEKGVLLRNPETWLNCLKPLLSCKYWTEEHNEIFRECFHFVPHISSVIASAPIRVKPEFFYAFVEYSTHASGRRY